MTDASSTGDVRIRVSEHILSLTLARPGARNALSSRLMGELLDALDAAEADPDVRVAVIRAEGPAFCAGHDLREIEAAPDRAAREAIFALCSRLMTRVARFPKPVIAEVGGIATAAGCQLVASCDLVVAAPEAAFATPGVRIGLFCSTPAVALSRAVGRKAAMEMLLTGEAIPAARAAEIGLVNRVVPAAMLRDDVDALARRIAGHSSHVIALGKAAFERQSGLDLDAAYAEAGRAMVDNLEAEDAREGIEAFLEKRPAVWRDR